MLIHTVIEGPLNVSTSVSRLFRLRWLLSPDDTAAPRTAGPSHPASSVEGITRDTRGCQSRQLSRLVPLWLTGEGRVYPAAFTKTRRQIGIGQPMFMCPGPNPRIPGCCRPES